MALIRPRYTGTVRSANRRRPGMWDDISFDEIPDPGPRPVTIATLHLRPTDTGSPQASVRRFLDVIEKGVPSKTDVILLPEVITPRRDGEDRNESGGRSRAGAWTDHGATCGGRELAALVYRREHIRAGGAGDL